MTTDARTASAKRRKRHQAAASRVLVSGLATASTLWMAATMASASQPFGAPADPTLEAAVSTTTTSTSTSTTAAAPAPRIVVVRRHHPAVGTAAAPATRATPATRTTRPAVSATPAVPAAPAPAPAPPPAPAPRKSPPTTQSSSS